MRHMYFFIGGRSLGVKSRNSSKRRTARAGSSPDTRCRPRTSAMPDSDEPAFPPIVLTFAASDPSGGAGLQADILTLASMGTHPLSVVTAITVQDTLGVEALQAQDAEWVADQ